MKFYLYGNMAHAFFIMARALLIWPMHFSLVRAHIFLFKVIIGPCSFQWPVLLFVNLKWQIAANCYILRAGNSILPYPMIPILRLEGMTNLNDNSAEKKGLVHAMQSDGPHPSNGRS